MHKITFEIEDYFGNTMIAFEVKVNEDGEVDVTQTLNCSHADTDSDYIFDTDNKLIIIQNDNIIKKNIYYH